MNHGAFLHLIWTTTTIQACVKETYVSAMFWHTHLLVHFSALSVKLPRQISWDIYNVRQGQILTYKPCC